MSKEVSDSSDIVPLILFDIGKDGTVLYAGQNVHEFLGIESETILNLPVTSFLQLLLPPTIFDIHCRDIESVLTGRKKSWSIVEDVQLKNSTESKRLRFHLETERPEVEGAVLVLSDRTSTRVARERLAELTTYSDRLIEFGKIIIVRTDRVFGIKEILGNTQRVLGIQASTMLAESRPWELFLLGEDYKKLRLTIRSMGRSPTEIDQEIRIIHQVTGETRWLALTAIPFFSDAGECIGWEGFGVDVTVRREAQQKLLQQKRRTEALYEITRRLQVNMDPAFVALNGLQTLIRATNSSSGFCTLYDRHTDKMELVATHGCSQRYVDAMNAIMNKGNLLRKVIANQEGFVTSNLQELPEAKYGVAKAEDLRSAIFMPLIYEDPDEGSLIVGAMQLASKVAGIYTLEDFELVRAASVQISLVIRQAEYYAAEQEEVATLSSLYELNHSLVKVHTPEEAAACTFAVIQKQIECKRTWLGVLNEQGSHLVGVGGTGPGMRTHINKLQLELALPHDFIDEAMKMKQPLIVEAGTPMECSGLTVMMQRLSVGTIVIVPVIALGRVTAMLLLEPQVGSEHYIKRKIPLLKRLCNELGTVLLTRKLEERIVNADKMRMAGLLASGVAHNFNNLLQAVMGQASLIEMQLPANSPLRLAAGTITKAATRGAELIRHMLSVSQHGSIKRTPIVIAEFLESSREMYSSLLGTAISFTMTIRDGEATVMVDNAAIQQVLTNLLVNSREALAGREDPAVLVETRVEELRIGEVDPQLSPGKYLRIDVSDNGIGMDAESQARCFEPFYSTKNVDEQTGVAFDGTGFGLSVSYSILRQHNGMLTLRSEVGVGSFFSIFLPCAPTKSVSINQTIEIERSSLKNSVSRNYTSSKPFRQEEDGQEL